MTSNSPIETKRTPGLALVVLLLGAFMALLDTTIVNVAIPTIQTGLHASDATISWVVSGYVLAFGLVLIPAGWIGDRTGHRIVFITGMALFTAASLACGLASSQSWLVTARIVQGIGGGLTFTPVTALIQVMFTGRARGRAFSFMGAVIGFATALGPLAGGLIIAGFGNDHGWRYVFGVNVPLGIVALLAAPFFLPARQPDTRRAAADWIGLLLLTTGLIALIVPLIQGQQNGWPWWTFTSLIGSVLLLVGFLLWERRVEGSGQLPLIPPHLLARGSFTGGVILAAVYFAAFTSIFFTLSILWQTGLKHSALATGILLLPFAVASIAGASTSDSLAARYGRSVLTLGLALVAAGITAIWIILLTVPVTTLNGWQLTAPLLIAGLGGGLFIAPNVDFIVAGVNPTEAGTASGIVGTAQRIGSAIGIAIMATVLFGTLNFTNRPDAVPLAFTHSATYAMAVSAAFAIAAFALVFTLPRTTTT
ncbi:MAG: MFS transporter [Actinomycetota bacterium]|nr:MFS transporter [Actinomycetota bacterium]